MRGRERTWDRGLQYDYSSAQYNQNQEFSSSEDMGLSASTGAAHCPAFEIPYFGTVLGLHCFLPFFLSFFLFFFYSKLLWHSQKELKISCKPECVK